MLPLKQFSMPFGPEHPGSFAAFRKHDRHTGLDLYCNEGDFVYAIEKGVIVRIDKFTGPGAGSPWWYDTWAMVIEGSRTILYGEINPFYELKPGVKLARGDIIGTVAPVLPPYKARADVAGHAHCMLHLEYHTTGFHEFPVWPLDAPQPFGVLNPLSLLITEHY